MSIKAKAAIITGCLCILLAAGLTIYNTRDASRAEKTAQERLEELDREIAENTTRAAADTADETATGQSAQTETMEEQEMPVLLADNEGYIGILEIPSLNLRLPILSSLDYAKLRIAPCRYDGSAYQDDMILAAHNYSRHFGQIKDLQPGDIVNFTDTEGHIFSYTVQETEYLKGTDIDKMYEGDWDLTLFTCTLGGRKRVTVRCVKTNELAETNYLTNSTDF